MSTLSSMNRSERSDTFLNVVNPDCGLKTCRPSPTKGQTTIRILPEIASDGTLRPMFISKSAGGDVWSSLQIENVSVNVGFDEKFTVLNTPSDKPALDQMNSPFSGAYIKLKSKQKKALNGTEPYPSTDYGNRIEALFKGVIRPPNKFPTGQALQQGKDMVFLQAVVLQLNGETLMKPASKQLVILTSQTAKGLQEVLAKAQKDKVDLFNPKTGHAIVLKPIKQLTNEVMVYDAEIGVAAPLPEETCRKLWVPWERVFVRHTHDALLSMLIRALGADTASLVFPTDVARVLKAETAGRVSVPAVAAAPAVTAPAPVAAAAPAVSQPVAAAPVAAPAAAPRAAPAAAPVMELQIDADAPADDLETPAAGGRSSPGASAPAVAQTTEELEKMFADLLKDDPSLGTPPA